MGCSNSLSEHEVRLGQRNVIRDGLMTQVMSTLTGSLFLTAFAVALGASNFVIGLLATIPLLSNLVQIPAIYIVEKYRIRRRITIAAAAAARMFLLVIAVIPFLFPLSVALLLMILALVANSLLGAVGGCSWNSWMHDLLPHETLGRFFSNRMLLATAVGIPLSLGAGFFLDAWVAANPSANLAGYSILYAVGCLAGLGGVFVISRIPEPRMEATERVPRFKELLKQPFTDRNFSNLIVFLTSWNFAINLALPFFTVYMLKTLGMEMSLVVVLSVVSQMTSVAFFRIWGKLSDKYSNKSVLRVSGPIYLVAIAAWTLTTIPSMSALALPILMVIHILMGIAQAGVNLTSGNIGLKLAPKGKATAYLASSSFFSNLAAGSAPILGGVLAYYMPWEAFFIGAFVLGALSVRWLSKVKEDGEVEDKVIAHEFVVEIRNGVKSIERLPEVVIPTPRSAKAFMATLAHFIWK